jgi:hypothetical protein
MPYRDVPRKGELVSSFNPREQAWKFVEEGIKSAVKKFRATRKEPRMMPDPLLGRGLR